MPGHPTTRPAGKHHSWGCRRQAATRTRTRATWPARALTGGPRLRVEARGSPNRWISGLGRPCRLEREDLPDGEPRPAAVGEWAKTFAANPGYLVVLSFLVVLPLSRSPSPLLPFLPFSPS